MQTAVLILMALAMFTTLAVLFTGLISMARGGEFNRRHGNRLMRWRVLAQFVAILIFAFAMMLAKD